MGCKIYSHINCPATEGATENTGDALYKKVLIYSK